jgi:hypothetical protein
MRRVGELENSIRTLKLGYTYDIIKSGNPNNEVLGNLAAGQLEILRDKLASQAVVAWQKSLE